MLTNLKSNVSNSNLDETEKNALLDIMKNSQPIKTSRKFTKYSEIYDYENIYIFITASIFSKNVIVDYYFH